MPIVPLLEKANAAIAAMQYRYIPPRTCKNEGTEKSLNRASRQTFGNVLEQSPRAGPTTQTHYVVEPSFLAGASVDDMTDYAALRAIGVDVFVCLRAEWPADQFFSHPKLYPQFESKCDDGNKGDVLFIHFPIEDFEPCVSNDELVSLVRLLEKLINDEERKVLVHCRGGHGRTTIVSLPLLAALDRKERSSTGVGELIMAPAEIKEENQSMEIDRMFSHYELLHTSRQYCQYLCQLPETNEQERQIRQIIKDHFL